MMVMEEKKTNKKTFSSLSLLHEIQEKEKIKHKNTTDTLEKWSPSASSSNYSVCKLNASFCKTESPNQILLLIITIFAHLYLLLLRKQRK